MRVGLVVLHSTANCGITFKSQDTKTEASTYLQVLHHDEGDGALRVLIRHRVEQPEVLHAQYPLQVQDGVE